MQEVKLTDEEIVKALEICYNDVHCSVDCPYFNLNGRNFCQDKELYKDLKRIVLEHSEQKEEIERLTEEKDKYQEKWQTAYMNELNFQKQVDEFVKIARVSDTKKLVDSIKQQAVKDTAKEILDKCIAIDKSTGGKGFVCIEAIAELAKGKGAEVE